MFALLYIAFWVVNSEHFYLSFGHSLSQQLIQNFHLKCLWMKVTRMLQGMIFYQNTSESVFIFYKT